MGSTSYLNDAGKNLSPTCSIFSALIFRISFISGRISPVGDSQGISRLTSCQLGFTSKKYLSSGSKILRYGSHWFNWSHMPIPEPIVTWVVWCPRSPDQDHPPLGSQCWHQSRLRHMERERWFPHIYRYATSAATGNPVLRTLCLI